MRKRIRLFGRNHRSLLAAAIALLSLAGYVQSSAFAAGLVYVEANDGFDGPANIGPAAAIDSTQSIVDNKWGYRALGSGAVVFESSPNLNPGAEDSPELTFNLSTTNGLVAGQSYDIYVAYWSATGQDWSIQGSLPGGSKTLFNRTGPVSFLPNAVAGISGASAIWSMPPAFTVENDRVMLLGKVGTAVATGGQINVLIDDLPTANYPVDIPPANAFNYRSWLDGVAFIEAGKALSLSATIDRTDGKLSLVNNTGSPVSFTAINITSASQALNASTWLSITNNYDTGALDTDPWQITAPATTPLPSFAGALTESEAAATGGATFAANAPPVNLGTVWQDTRFSDVQIAVTLAGGTVINITPTYSGPEHLLGDFDNNGSRGLTDYQVLTSNMHKSFTTLGQAEAYLKGDMNGDLVVSYADFVAFRTAFTGPGAGSFDAMFGQVPEPTTAILFAFGAILLGSVRSFGRTSARKTMFCDTTADPTDIPDSNQPSSSRTSSMIRTRALCLLAAFALLPSVDAQAINVNLTGSDGLGGSSFNAAGFWNNAAPPSAANDYFTGDFILRTPPDANSHTFGGNSLTVNNTNGYPQGLFYKGTGNTGIVTINNLKLDGGLIAHGNGVGDLFQLAGSISVNSASTIFAKQGNIDISAPISGTAGLTIPQTDAPTETGNRFVTLLGANTYTGNINVVGKLRLGPAGSMKFQIGANGVNNNVSGTGIAQYNGAFNIDLTGASTTLGHSWTLTSVATPSYGDTFDIPGFLEYASGMWVKDSYQFSEATGILSVAPAPDLLTLRVNTTNGEISIRNATSAANFDMNYYEIRSASGALDLVDWASIDGNIPASTTSWEKAGGATANLISETNLLGSKPLAPNNGTTLGVGAYAGTTLANQDLQFFYGTTGSSSLFRGFVEYVTSTATPGDYNGDGKVNAADYTVWRDSLGANVAQGTGADGNNNGQIDPGDYGIWKSNFGAGGVGSFTTQQVPEPSSLLLVTFLAAWVANLRRRIAA
jgi:hypothetical protein